MPSLGQSLGHPLARCHPKGQLKDEGPILGQQMPSWQSPFVAGNATLLEGTTTRQSEPIFARAVDSRHSKRGTQARDVAAALCQVSAPVSAVAAVADVVNGRRGRRSALPSPQRAQPRQEGRADSLARRRPGAQPARPGGTTAAGRAKDLAWRGCAGGGGRRLTLLNTLVASQLPATWG